jgi:hypothetical protein
MVEPDFWVYGVAPLLAVAGYLVQGGLCERSAHARFFYRGEERRGEERRGGHCGFVQVACGLHALRIWFDCGLLTFPAGRCRFLCGFSTLGACCGPGIVLGPIVDLVSAFLPIQKSDLS